MSSSVASAQLDRCCLARAERRILCLFSHLTDTACLIPTWQTEGQEAPSLPLPSCGRGPCRPRILLKRRELWLWALVQAWNQMLKVAPRSVLSSLWREARVGFELEPQAWVAGWLLHGRAGKTYVLGLSALATEVPNYLLLHMCEAVAREFCEVLRLVLQGPCGNGGQHSFGSCPVHLGR